jgi:hypothetical protein
MSLAWSITLNGAPASCGAVGGVTVEVVATPVGGGQGRVDDFACGQGRGATADLPAGAYTVHVHLLDGASAFLADYPIDGSVTVVAGNTADLGSRAFAITRALPPGTFTMTWDVAVDGLVTLCGSVSATTFELDATPPGGGADQVSRLDCTLHGGTSAALAPGVYDVVARLRDANGEPVDSVEVGTKTIASGAATDLGEIGFDIASSAGWLSVSWSLEHGGVATTCSAVGAVTVAIDITPQAGGATITDTYTCSDGTGTTDYLVPGTYDLAVSALDGDGLLLGTAPGTSATVETKVGVDVPSFLLTVVQ